MSKSKNKIERIIEEDLVNYSSNKGGAGYDWHNYQRPERANLIDILKVDPDEMNRASSVLPHQIQKDHVLDQLIELYDNNYELQAQFTKALKNPIIDKDDQSKKKIKDAIEKFSKAAELYNDVAEDLRSLEM